MHFIKIFVCRPLQAVEELFNLMQLFVAQRPDMREEELEDIKQFKKTTISCYLRCLDGRSCWTTLIRSGHNYSVKLKYADIYV